MLGARTEEIPGELRSTLSRDHMASVVVFDIDADQDIPFWSLVNALPVKVRINKFREGTSHLDDYIIFNTTYGIDQASMTRWRHNKETIQEWEEPDSTAVDSTATVPPTPPAKPQAEPKPQAKPEPKPQAKPEPKPSVAAKPAANIQNATSGPYHVIVGSSVKQEVATTLADKLKKQGYKGVRIIEGDGRYRVAIASFATVSAANAAVAEMAKNPEYKTAWALHKKID